MEEFTESKYFPFEDQTAQRPMTDAVDSMPQHHSEEASVLPTEPLQASQESSPVATPSATTEFAGYETRRRKRTREEREATNAAPTPASVDFEEDSSAAGAYSFPTAKRGAFTIEDKFFQKLFFRTLSFLTLEEVRSICAQAPIPIFVKVPFDALHFPEYK
jgi:hypothetical protein